MPQDFFTLHELRGSLKFVQKYLIHQGVRIENLPSIKYSTVTSCKQVKRQHQPESVDIFKTIV